MDTQPNEAFFDTLPVFEEFEGVADGDNYRPLPDNWALATADIVGSTKAIASGRYKAVNMAGASVISAILNSVGRRDLPFVFGGDGAFVAIPGSAIEETRHALAAVKTWVGEELELDLRTAIVPMGDIRAQGLDVRVARFQASSEIAYAMFTGGGASWAEAQMKAGNFAVAAAPPGTRPDLTGLSCRWNPDRGASRRDRLDHRHPRRRRSRRRVPAACLRRRRAGQPAGARRPSGACRRSRRSAFRRAAWTTRRAPPRPRASGCGPSSSSSSR